MAVDEVRVEVDVIDEEEPPPPVPPDTSATIELPRTRTRTATKAISGHVHADRFDLRSSLGVVDGMFKTVVAPGSAARGKTIVASAAGSPAEIAGTAAPAD